jgi:hypothetical protein
MGMYVKMPQVTIRSMTGFNGLKTMENLGTDSWM